MDPFAHIQTIKVLATLAIGYFCYRRLKNISQEDV